MPASLARSCPQLSNMPLGPLSTPQTSGTSKTTATVIEFICLFTRDVKRKNQKRWVDGRLKFHTYNKTISVIDEHGFRIGQSKWYAERGDFCEGVELMLESAPILVEVCEELDRQEQDLGDLVDKRAREVEERRVKAAQTPSTGHRPNDNLHLSTIQRPRNTAVSASGPIGRAVVPTKSPYEVRMQAGPGDDSPQESKRRKLQQSPPIKMGHARALFGTQLMLSAQSIGGTAPRSQVQKDRSNVRLLSSLPQSVKSRNKDEHDEEEEKDDVLMVDAGSCESPSPKQSLTKSTVRTKDREKRSHERPKQKDIVTTTERPKKVAKMTKPPIFNAPQKVAASTSDNISENVILVTDSPSPPRQDSAELVPKISSRAKTLRHSASDHPEHVQSSRSSHKPSALKGMRRKKNLLISRTLNDQPSNDSVEAFREGRGEVERREENDEESLFVSSQPTCRSFEGQDTTRDKSPTPEKEDQRSVQKATKHKRKKTASQVDHAGPFSDKGNAIESSCRQEKEGVKTSSKMGDDSTKEPGFRTELRIKPRKKRGLLMLSEKVTLPSTKLDITPKPAVHREPSPVMTDTGFDDWLLNADRATGSTIQVIDSQSEATPPTESCEAVNTNNTKMHTGGSSPSYVIEKPDVITNPICGDSDRTDAPTLKETEEQKSQKDDLNCMQITGNTKSATVGELGPSSPIQSLKAPDQPVVHLRSDHGGGEIPKERRRKDAKEIPMSPEDSKQNFTLEDENEDELEPPQASPRRRRSSKQQDELVNDREFESEEDWKGPAPALKRKSTRTTSKKSQEESTNDSKGPRIVRMARKSVKCKEIVGLKAPSTDYTIPNQLATATARISMATLQFETPKFEGTLETQAQPAKEPTPEPNECEKMQEQSGNNKSQGQEKREESSRRIANPATRGKKAAKESDAAGRMPMVMVPFDPVPAVPARRTSALSAPVLAPVQTPHNAPVSAKSSLPGFSKANGGAWSEHAHDLLGIDRPKGRA